MGDRLNISGVENLGYLNRNRLSILLMKSKYAILSNENLISFFAIECLNANMKLITNNKINKLEKQIRKNIYISQPNKN